MGSWRGETTSDLSDADRRIQGVIETISGEPSDAQVRSIWRAYLLVEKSIVFIKVEIQEDTPGRTVKLGAYSVPDERQALGFAQRNLRKGTESFRVGNLSQALMELRECRNYLRVMLRQKRLASLRRARG